MAQSHLWVSTTGGYPTALHKISRTPASSIGPTDVQVRIRAAALNPVEIQKMNLPLWSLPLCGYPKGVGCDFSGTVLKAGAEVKDLGEGDEVMGFVLNMTGPGTLAEVETFDTATSAIVKKPEAWTWAKAAGVPLVWLTAKLAAEQVRSYVKSTTKTVVVLGGSSGTGIYTVLLAKREGWRVVATCSGRNTEFVRGLGADEVVDYTEEDVRERVRAARPDAIIDCVGGTECLGIAKRYVTIVGDKTSRNSMGGAFLYLYKPMMNLRWLLGRLGLGEVYDCIVVEPRTEWLAEARELRPDQIFIDSEFEFDDVKRAYERLHTGRARGKVVVNVAQ